VRYHKEIDLLPMAARSKNGYRVHTQADIERLRFIQRAKVLDFSLAVIREILGLHERD
jgi:DNA-binding transcriptional MerR regulator